MLNPKVLLVSAIAVTTSGLFFSQVGPVTGELACETWCRLYNVTGCEQKGRKCTYYICSSTDGNNSKFISQSTGVMPTQGIVTTKEPPSHCQWMVACRQANVDSANRCCICKWRTRPPICCLTDQSCAQILQLSVQEASCHDDDGTKTSTTVDVTAGSSLDFKSSSINSLASKPGAGSTSTAPTSMLSEFSVKNSSTMSTNYEPDVSVSPDSLLAGVLSVVGILCISAVAVVVVFFIIVRTVRKKAMQIERVRECNCYEEGPNNNSNRNPNTATATQPNAGCVGGRLLSNPVYSTSPLQEEPNTTPLYQGSSFDAEAPSLMHTYERVLSTSPGASDELCNNGHSPAPYEMPIPHPTKSAVPVAVESDSKEYAQLERSHVYATLEPFIAKHEDIEEQNDDYSCLHN